MTQVIEVAPESDRELVLARIIDAPRDKVYRAWTDPEVLTRWFTPPPWTTPHAELDVRAGGANLVLMRGPEGQEMPNRGVYLEVVPNEKLVFTDAFTKAWEPSGKAFMVVVLTLEDAGDGKTGARLLDASAGGAGGDDVASGEEGGMMGGEGDHVVLLLVVGDHRQTDFSCHASLTDRSNGPLLVGSAPYRKAAVQFPGRWRGSGMPSFGVGANALGVISSAGGIASTTGAPTSDSRVVAAATAVPLPPMVTAISDSGDGMASTALHSLGRLFIVITSRAFGASGFLLGRQGSSVNHQASDLPQPSPGGGADCSL